MAPEECPLFPRASRLRKKCPPPAPDTRDDSRRCAGRGRARGAFGRSHPSTSAVRVLPVRSRRAVAGSLALGAGVTWNVGNVGAAAERLAAEYDVSLPIVGLLTTALFVTHIAVQ